MFFQSLARTKTRLNINANPNTKTNMTGKYFCAVATRLNEALRLSDDRERIYKLAVSLADDFDEFTPNFNRSKFLELALA